MLVLLVAQRLFLQGVAEAQQTPTNVSTAATNTSEVKGNSPARQTDPAADLIRRFQIKRGFRIELVASEPLVVDPVGLAFDESGRLFVVESHLSNPGPGQTGRLRVLDDRDNDGTFKASSVFADNLDQPSAVACYDGGVFVACGSQILFLKDTDGDGVADVRRVAFTRYGDAAHANQPTAITSLAWGLDNRIHAGTAGNGGSVSAAAPAKSSVALTDGNFAFDPRTSQLQAESGVAPTGLCFDDRGRKFVCSSGDHIVQVMFEARYAGRRPDLLEPGALLDIAAAGPATVIFPSRAAAPGPAPGRFAWATGLTIYRGDAFPADYIGDSFVADAAAGIVHHEKLRPNGLEVIAERSQDEPGPEFLSAKDASFRPIQLINGPDGALYIADQPTGPLDVSVTKPGTTNAVKNPTGRGRIYRIVPVGFKQPKTPHLNTAKSPDLAAMLRSRNGWLRDTAARLLYERRDRAAIASLVGLFMDPKSPPLSRVHALHALDGLNALVEPHVLKGLIDPDERVREHALRLAERFMGTNGVASDLLSRQLAALASDPAIQVRYQLAFTLGQSRDPSRIRLLAELLRRDAGNRWVQTAVMSSLASGAGEMFSILAAGASTRDVRAGDDTLEQLLLIATIEHEPDEIYRILNSLASLPDSARTFRLVRVLADGLQRSNTPLKAVDTAGILRELYSRAARIASDYNAPDAVRTEAILLFANTSFAEAGNALLGMLNLASTQPVQVAAITTLEQFKDPAIAPALLQRWGLLAPGGRAEAIVALLSRPERTTILLSALENSTINRAEIKSPQIQFLLEHPEPAIRERAGRLFGNRDAAQRQNVVARLMPASGQAGNAARGQNIFATRCGGCHQLASVGSAAALDLTYAARGNRETMLAKILDPNRDVDPNHPFCLVETAEGETLTGFITAQTTGFVTLFQTTGSVRQLARSRINSVQALPGSAMPEGLESGLGQQDLSDLLEFLADAAPLSSR